MTKYLMDGNPMRPTEFDLIAETRTLEVGKPVPEGWRVLTGNGHSSLIARVAYRFEIEEEMK